MFVELVLQEPKVERLMIEEYISISDGKCSKNSFLDFLKDKLEIAGYWEKVGLA